MNRMEEYQLLLAQLEQVPEWDPVSAAKKRMVRKHRILRPLISAAAAFCLFVCLINVSPAVSAACRELPFLKELVGMLTFNPSLRVAVEHDYVQLVGQKQTKDEITARVEYLIVDQKQVNIFYTLSSEVYDYLDATPDVWDQNGKGLPVGMTYGSIPDEEDGLRHITIDFIEEDVPDYMELTLCVRDLGARYGEEEAPVHADDSSDAELSQPLAEFAFDLYFDPKYTAQGKTIELNKTVVLDNQRITLTDMEIYPTHIRINVEEDENNTAWLKSLKFYLELEDGVHVETISNGISATGHPETPSMVSYRAESSFFYDADCIRLYITSTDFLYKDREKLYINLDTLESDPLPQGLKLYSAVRKQNGTKLTFLVEQSEISHVQALGSTYHDMGGTEYHCGSWSFGESFYDNETQQVYPEWGYETYHLEDFVESEAIFTVNYTHFWIPDEPFAVELVDE